MAKLAQASTATSTATSTSTSTSVRACTGATSSTCTGAGTGAGTGKYKEELFRTLSLMGTFSTSFAQQGVMASTTLLFSYGLTNGGPAVMLYVWIIGSVLSIGVAMCLAEICSRIPYAGSVYQWVGEMAKEEEAPILSYCAGWLNFLGNAMSAVGYTFGFGQFVAALYDIYHPDNSLDIGFQVLIAMLGAIVMGVVNCLRIDKQAWLNKATFVLSLGSLVGICAALMVADNKKQTIHWAFTTFYNDSGFDNFGYVVLTAILTLLFGVAGYEASAHLAEETTNPRLIAPWGMVLNIFTTCIFGFVYLLVLILNIPTVLPQDAADDNVIAYVLNTNYANSAIAVFVAAVGKRGAFAMTTFIVLMGFMAGLANMTITVRIGWAMARDGAFPYSEWLRKVDKTTQEPLRVIFAVVVFQLVMLLLPLGSTLAFAAVTSISTIFYQASYAFPIWLRIFSKTFVPEKCFSLGAISVPLNVVSLVFLIVTGSFCFFPQSFPVNDVNTFDWTIIVTPVFVLCGIAYWVLYARHYFLGPLRTMFDMKDEGKDLQSTIEADV